MAFAPLGAVDINGEIAEFLTHLHVTEYLVVTFYASRGVFIEVHLEVNNSYILFAGSQCDVSPEPLMERIRALVNSKVWAIKDGGKYAQLYGWPYGEKDDFYRAMAAKCQSDGKYLKPDAAKLDIVIRWAKGFELKFVVRETRLFIRFNSRSMQVDFERTHLMHDIGVVEEGDENVFTEGS